MIEREGTISKAAPDFLSGYIPKSLWQKLSREFSSVSDLEKVLVWQEDLAHSIPHVRETMGIYHYLCEAYEIGPIEQDWGMRAIKLHDSGNRLVQKGVIDQKEHHFGSIFIAGILDPDIHVVEAIRLHVRDVLPKKVPRWLRLVRDADRISSLGFTGANRLATFFGYKEYKFLNLGQPARSGVYCELGPCPDYFDRGPREVPWKPIGSKEEASRYEKKAEKYFINKVLPALYRNGRLKDFCDYMKRVYSWFIGTPSVEAVVRKAHLMYSSRAAVTRNISTIYHRVSLFPGGTLVSLERANLRRERKFLSESYDRPHISYL